MVLEYLKINGTIRNAKIRELCGFTKQQVRATIDKMMEESLIFRVGAGSATEYKLKLIEYIIECHAISTRFVSSGVFGKTKIYYLDIIITTS